MRVLLSLPSLDVPKFKGLAKVSLKLVEGLKDKVDLKVYEAYKEGKSYFKNLTITPLTQLKTKADIYHAVTPENGTFTPFFRKNTVVTIHDFIPYTQDIKFKDFALAYTTFMWGLAIKKSKVIIANSSLTAKQIKNIFKRDSIVINPGVDEKFKKMNIKKDKITLGFFANFSFRKRVNVAIEVFKILKKKVDCKLIIAGGELQTIYQKQFNVKKLTKGLEDVEILGYVPEDKVVELYNSFDFFLFPSKIEGFGIPILEAQACGIPTFILSDALIPDEVKAKAIVCDSAEDMANKILELINDKYSYRRISEEGIKYAKKFTWENFIEKHIQIYESLL